MKPKLHPGEMTMAPWGQFMSSSRDDWALALEKHEWIEKDTLMLVLASGLVMGGPVIFVLCKGKLGYIRVFTEQDWKAIPS